MTHYSRGAAFERLVKADLEKRGYLVVRSAGSHGVADLVAVPGDDCAGGATLLVQCKTSGRMSPKERQEMTATSMNYDALAVRAWRPKRGRICYDRPDSGEWAEVWP